MLNGGNGRTQSRRSSPQSSGIPSNVRHLSKPWTGGRRRLLSMCRSMHRIVIVRPRRVPVQQLSLYRVFTLSPPFTRADRRLFLVRVPEIVLQSLPLFHVAHPADLHAKESLLLKQTLTKCMFSRQVHDQLQSCLQYIVLSSTCTRSCQHHQCRLSSTSARGIFE